jgi:hypothetical protein
VDIESINNLSVLESKEHRLSEKWKHYTSIASKFKEFLLQTSTEDSLTEYEAFNAATDNNITLIEEMFEKIESRRFCFSTNSSRARAASALACLRASVDDLADKLDEF